MHGNDAWAVVLAGGDGVRLRTLARALYGTDLPKQFLPLLDGRSLLQATLDRISSRFDRERIVVVVGKAYRSLAEEQLRDHAIHLISQPRNLGTGPGILLPLAWIRGRDPDARIAIFPSDHHVPHPEPLLSGVQRALDSTRFDRVVLGVKADMPETDLGWIVSHHTGPALGPRAVLRFVEKPSRPMAEQLFRQGALWNTFLLVGKLQAMWSMAVRSRPRLASLFDTYGRSIGGLRETSVLDAVYAQAAPVDFSRDILQQAEGLGVVRVHGSGWSDWGSPERVLRALRGTTDHSRVLASIASGGNPARGGAGAERFGEAASQTRDLQTAEGALQ
jgi:mannose-1-phosphate guanylyltransferase